MQKRFSVSIAFPLVFLGVAMWLFAETDEPEESSVIEVKGVECPVTVHPDGSRSVSLSEVVISRAVRAEDENGQARVACQTGFVPKGLSALKSDGENLRLSTGLEEK